MTRHLFSHCWNVFNLFVDEKVSNLDDIPDMEAATVHTNNGMTIEADLVIKCTGLRINSEGYSEGLGKSIKVQI